LQSSHQFGSGVRYILKTMGKDGMILYDQTSNKSQKIRSTPVDVFNVSGAGDTVIAIMAVCLSMGITPLISAKIANSCAHYVVTQPGTTFIPKELFKDITYSIGGFQNDI